MSIVDPTRAPRSRRFRSRVATLGAVAIATSAALLTASPAQAAERPVDSGTVHWGYKHSFRAYVGNQTAALPPIGALPMGERITLTSPAQFDTNGTPASPTNTSVPNETLPYALPVTSGTFTDDANFTLQTSGAVNYHFPSHFFEISLSNIAVEVEAGSAVITADVFQETTEDFGEFPAGVFEGTAVPIATIDSPSVSVSGNALTFSGTNVIFTEAGSALLPQTTGDVMDNISLTATLGTVVEPPTWTPQLSLSKSSGFNPDGSETVTVTGTGFDPNANIGTRPPLSGQAAGFYVVFGKFADTWKPSAGAPTSARTVIDQKWPLPPAAWDTLGGTNAQYVQLSADGSFSTQLKVEPRDAVVGNYGVYTYGASGAVNAAQELFVPVSFAVPGTSEGDLDIDVTVPEGTDPGDPGEFVWRVDGGVTAVNLGIASVDGDHFSATGDLAPIIVTDTRTGGPAWSVSAQVSDFASATDSFEGKHLGWTPGVISAGAGAVAGAPVQSGLISGSGLADSRTLGAATSGHATGSATLGAGLDLRLPLTTPAGDYTGTLTITAVS